MLAHSVRIAKIVKQAVSPDEDKLNAEYVVPKAKPRHIILNPEEEIRREIRASVGKIDPLIKHGVENALKEVSYKRKTKSDAMGDVIEHLHKKLEALQEERFSLEQRPFRGIERNPLLELDSDISEDFLEEKEILRAYKNKDAEKLEWMLSKNRARLEEIEEKYRKVTPFVNISNLEALDKSTVSVRMSASDFNQTYEKVKTNSSWDTSYRKSLMTASTSASRRHTPTKKLF